jgi:hypothetical protein
MSRAWYSADAKTFATANPMLVLGALGGSSFADEPTQKAAWRAEIAHLQPIAASLPIFFWNSASRGWAGAPTR